MGSEFKNGGNEMIESGKELAVVAEKSKMRGWDLLLRVAAVAFSLAAAVVLGLDKQTTTVTLTLVPTLPPVDIPVTAKWHYLSASVYFVVANTTACAYGAISLLLLSANRGGKKRIAMTVVVFDLMIVALLFSSLGAVAAIGIISLKGNAHVQWHKVCSVFGKFCNQGAAAIGLSGVASTVFLVLVLVAILELHWKR
ncbi:CASP-like protein 1E2 [Sesamum angolense]|uniref:CASP-like protein n=1 Tax=Sesamum angolense TaxID=2727404 RepID=A0AAE1W141_9LAMI|nr:CASP-like protein 1E2 [Sesamum angolense]